MPVHLMPDTPYKLATAYDAYARIEPIHSVVFGGFDAEPLQNRISAAVAKVLLTANGGHPRGPIIPRKHDGVYWCSADRRTA